MSASNLSWLKKKSQSVDITAPGFNPPAGAAKPAAQASKVPSVAKTPTIVEEENNTDNAQKRNPRRSELKRFYTIDTGQKKTLDKKDPRRLSFQRPKGTIEYTVGPRDSLNSIALSYDTTPNELVQLNKLFSRAVVTGQVLYVPDPNFESSIESSPTLSPVSPMSPSISEPEFDKPTDSVQQQEATSPAVFTDTRPARIVSSTSEEEEAFTEKFLKINCKYITHGKGTVSGVLLVTPNNIMFDPHKTDLLVQECGCEEYGIMCPMEEVMSAALYKEILDDKIQEFLPIEVDQLSVRGISFLKKMTRSNTDDLDSRIRDTGNDSASTAPRSTEESLSEDVFTESELSPIQEELTSLEELHQKKSDASLESAQTVQAGVTSDNLKGNNITQPADDTETVGHETNLDSPEVVDPDTNISQQSSQETQSQEENSMRIKINTNSLQESEDKKGNKHFAEVSECQKKETVNKGEQVEEKIQDFHIEVEELRKLWKSHTMEQTKQQRENIQQMSQKESKHKIATADGHIEGSGFLKEKKKHRLYKFLCLRVGKPMRKTFVSQASATMQQYAQRDKKHEYWFAVPQERTNHLYAFFIHWSPETYIEDTGEFTREPGFIVVKKMEDSETTDDDSASEDTVKEWEIATKESVGPKYATPLKLDLESEAFRPVLSDPSELLQPDQIEKLSKHLPPRTIGYPWTLVYGTVKHGTSLKTLYRTMVGLDTPVLMVIKDNDNQVFGALASEPLKVSDGFYGTGETFVFTFSPEFEIFKWTGDNMFFIKGDMDCLAFGGGGGEFALWLDGDLYHGRSHSCKTFGNRTLSKKEDFFIRNIEIWAFE